MSSTSEHAANGGEHHHGGPAVYTRNLIALLILTGLTVGASFLNLGSNEANVVVALAIATIKATLVALFFMHLRWDRPVNAIIAVTGFLFLGILLLFDFLDVGTRRDPRPLNVTVMEEPTPVPDTLNPLETPPPQPLAAPATVAVPGEGEGEAEGEE